MRRRMRCVESSTASRSAAALEPFTQVRDQSATKDALGRLTTLLRWHLAYPDVELAAGENDWDDEPEVWSHSGRTLVAGGHRIQRDTHLRPW